MVAFHDRRAVELSAPHDVAPGLDKGPGVALARKVINDRFVVKSALNDAGEREYSVHEALPTGEILTRDSGLPTRYAARKSALGMKPSSVREL